MPPSSVFASTSSAWAARPSDPSDVFFAQIVENGAPSGRAAKGGVGLLGVPFDGAVLGRPGARAGPDAIRAEMARLKPWTLGTGAMSPRVNDWGNVRMGHGDIDAAHQAIETAALEVLAAEQFPLALGGDHSITFPLVKAHEGRRQKLGVINLDAHLDIRDSIDGVANSGTSFRRLIDLGLVDPKNLVEIGIRDFANSAKYATAARAGGATIFGAAEWRQHGLATIEHAIEIASDGVDGVYLSVDMDVLDQAHAPGVSAPTPGGIDTGRLFAGIRHIAARCPLVGADFVEVAPSLDIANMTSRSAAYGVMHLLAGLP